LFIYDYGKMKEGNKKNKIIKIKRKKERGLI